MYVQCLDNASVQRLTDMVYTIIEKHKHVHTCIYFSANVYTRMYMVCMYKVCTFQGINVYVHRSDMYVHVYTFMYEF